MLTALRTAKVDVLESIRWSAADELKKNAPKLQWNKVLAMGGMFVAMRVDQKPFDDIRVRRALNMAVNKQEIIKAYWGGNAEMLGFPMHPTWTGYYEPLSDMPESVKELFVHNPAKAKQLLAEAGYPNGFSFKTQTTSASTDNDLLAMVAAYLAKVGVKMEIQVMEYPAYMSAMGTKTNAPGYFMFTGATNPTTSLRKNFVKGQYWNPSQWADPRVRQEDGRGLCRARRAGAPDQGQADDARDPGEGAADLPAQRLQLHRVVAVGEELRRRAARRQPSDPTRSMPASGSTRT